MRLMPLWMVPLWPWDQSIFSVSRWLMPVGWSGEGLVADPQRIGGVEVGTRWFSTIDLRHAVVGGGQEKGSGRSRFRAGRV
jgi:hypothetical protein